MKKYISRIKNMNPKAIEVSSVVFGRFVLEKLNRILFELVALIVTTYVLRFIEVEANISGIIPIVCLLYMVVPVMRLCHHKDMEKFCFDFFKSSMYFILTVLFAAEFINVNEKTAESLFWYFLGYSIVYVIIKKLIPFAFNKYVNNNILNMDYLRPSVYKDNGDEGISVFFDAKEEDVQKRFETINKYAIKPDYQEIVELKYLNFESRSGFRYFYTCINKVGREFVDFDTTYYFDFQVFPLGKDVSDSFSLTRFWISDKVHSIASSLKVIELPVGIAKMKSKDEKKEDK